MMEKRFNPVKYGFRWNDDWYDFDGDAANIAAKTARDDYAAEERKAGRIVKKSTNRNQLITLGGIGTNHPQIEVLVTVFIATIIG